ncbi:hypothetical protein [Nocardia gipuzkoensis]|uniref:hypothetical protein n=1 Tax=Nocardia gipuzkoensis TaxID=2749991 RepID=UPI00237E6184|nr:hypothetical protein [Nocardia gipuzkoensis]MDE1675205.1 hypothetical protein [Nocardia gipuzkoensis]
MAVDGVRPGYLHPGTMTHMKSNIGDCWADPGPLPPGIAAHARSLHQYCSASCQVRSRAEPGLNLADDDRHPDEGIADLGDK